MSCKIYLFFHSSLQVISFRVTFHPGLLNEHHLRVGLFSFWFGVFKSCHQSTFIICCCDDLLIRFPPVLHTYICRCFDWLCTVGVELLVQVPTIYVLVLSLNSINTDMVHMSVLIETLQAEANIFLIFSRSPWMFVYQFILVFSFLSTVPIIRPKSSSSTVVIGYPVHSIHFTRASPLVCSSLGHFYIFLHLEKLLKYSAGLLSFSLCLVAHCCHLSSSVNVIRIRVYFLFFVHKMCQSSFQLHLR